MILTMFAYIFGNINSSSQSSLCFPLTFTFLAFVEFVAMSPLLFMFWCLGREAWEALAPPPGIELAPPHLGRWIPASGLSGKSLNPLHYMVSWVLMVERVSPFTDGEIGPIYALGEGHPWNGDAPGFLLILPSSPLCSKPQAELTNEEMWETNRVISLHEHGLLFILPSQNPLII